MAEKQTQTAGEQLSPPGNKIVEAETSLEAEKKGDAGDQDPLQNLPEDERRIIERQVYTEDVTVGYFALYRYASRMNLVVIFISAFGAIAGGALLPLFTVSAYWGACMADAGELLIICTDHLWPTYRNLPGLLPGHSRPRKVQQRACEVHSLLCVPCNRPIRHSLHREWTLCFVQVVHSIGR